MILAKYNKIIKEKKRDIKLKNKFKTYLPAKTDLVTRFFTEEYTYKEKRTADKIGGGGGGPLARFC